MVVPFDHDFVREAAERLSTLSQDATPVWGAMTPGQMIAHLRESVEYSMGLGPKVRIRTNWFARRILAPLYLNGLLPLPRNAEGLHGGSGRAGVGMDTEALWTVVDEYLGLVHTGEVDPAAHPRFGDIGVEGWGKLHVLHFEHHMRQFGL